MAVVAQLMPGDFRRQVLRFALRAHNGVWDAITQGDADNATQPPHLRHAEPTLVFGGQRPALTTEPDDRLNSALKAFHLRCYWHTFVLKMAQQN